MHTCLRSASGQAWAGAASATPHPPQKRALVGFSKAQLGQLMGFSPKGVGGSAPSSGLLGKDHERTIDNPAEIDRKNAGRGWS